MTDLKTQKFDLFTQFEKNTLEKSDIWFQDHLTSDKEHKGSRISNAPSDAGKLLVICMTPRSGSSALSMALESYAEIGFGGERLNPKPGGPLEQAAQRHAPHSRLELLDTVIEEAKAKNGISQLKCGFPQIFPFMMDSECSGRLKNAEFVYLTRQDILGQAISLYRGFQSGYWHATQSGAEKNVGVPYDFDGIHRQLLQITNMMAGFERAFASLDLRPLRITYENVIQNPTGVVRKIAARIGVSVECEVALETSGHTKISNTETAEMRARFLDDFQKMT